MTRKIEINSEIKELKKQKKEISKKINILKDEKKLIYSISE